MERWNKLLCSEKGKRVNNQDFVAIESIVHKKVDVELLVVCDGVGGRKNGEECSRVIGTKAIEVIKRYLARKRSLITFKAKDIEKLKKRLKNLYFSKEEIVDGATTITILLLDKNNSGEKSNLITIWAGDSRAYVMQTDGTFLQLTEDHHDDESRLTGYVTGNGRVNGNLGVSFERLDEICAVSVTSDGVHEKCEFQELKNFLLYCIEQKIQSNSEFTQLMGKFLSDNVSDNYSSALVYRFLTNEQLSRIVASLEK